MPSTRDGVESTWRRSRALNRPRGFHDGGRTGTAWSSSVYSAGPATYDVRILCRAISALVSLDVGDDVLDGADFLGVFVGDFDVEFFFQRHHQLDDIQ